MDLGSYVEWIEATRDPVELERIRAQALRDSDLDEVDKAVVSGRVATYLADDDRERRAKAERTDDNLEDVPEEEGA